MPEEAPMARQLDGLTVVPRLCSATPDPVDAALEQALGRVDDLEWRVDWLEAELAAERAQRLELAVELDSVRRLVNDGLVDANRRKALDGRLPYGERRRGDDGPRDTPPPSTAR